MSLARKIAHNTAIQVAGKLAGTVLSLLAAAMLFRYLEPAGQGQYTTILSFLQLFGIIMDFGLYIVLIKRIAQLDDLNHPIVHTIFTMRIVSGLIFLSIAPLAAWVLSWGNPAYGGIIIPSILVSTVFFLCISLNQLLSAIFQKVLRADWIALAEFVGKIALLGATIFVIVLKLNLVWVMGTLTLSSMINFGINYFAARKYVRLRLHWDWKIIKNVLKDSWPTAVSIVFSLIYFKGDVVILSLYHTSYETIGWYGAPYKILEVLVTFPAMFAGLALPVLTAAWKNAQRERFQQVLQKSVDALIIVAVPLIGGTLVLAPYIIQIIAGEKFLPSIPVLQVLIIATAAIFLGTLLSYVAVAIDKQKSMMWGYGLIAITGLTGYLVAIPAYGIMGAAWVTVYSEIAVILIAARIITRATHTHIHLRTCVKSVVASAAMYAGLWWCAGWLPQLIEVRNATIHATLVLAVMIPLGGIAYGIVLYMLKGIRKEDIKEIVRLKS